MRTNIIIDDELMTEAISATDSKTKKEAVEVGLQAWVRLRKQAEIRSLRKPEPYKGKGVRKVGEYVRMKEGKKK